MINLCLVVIATQFSETKKREMERMQHERRLQRHRESSSTVRSTISDSRGCYEELLRCFVRLLSHLKRRMVGVWKNFRRKRLDVVGAGGGGSPLRSSGCWFHPCSRKPESLESKTSAASEAAAAILDAGQTNLTTAVSGQQPKDPKGLRNGSLVRNHLDGPQMNLTPRIRLPMSAISEEKEFDPNQMERDQEVTEKVKSSNLDVETTQEERVSAKNVNFKGHSGVMKGGGKLSSIVGGRTWTRVLKWWTGCCLILSLSLWLTHFNIKCLCMTIF